MDISYELFQISDILSGNSWNITLLHFIFGDNMNFDYLTLGHVSINHVNSWVWHPKSRRNNLSYMVYSYLCQNAGPLVSWDGWDNLWRLKISPIAKHFIWLPFHNGIQTHEYLYRLNLGPRTLCGFWNLAYETNEYLFHHCPKSQTICGLISNDIGKPIYFLDGFISGNWLSPSQVDFEFFTQSIIAITTWLIWKARCNLII